MAKEDYAFKAPPFDEKAYMQKELFEGKRTLWMISYCVWMALLTSMIGLIPVNGNKIGIILGALGILGVRPFLLFVGKLDMTRMKPKDWLVTILFYVFGWMWLWLLFMQFIKQV
jgi:hypothetical protein